MTTLEQRVATLEANQPSSAAELFALASSRAAALLAMVAGYDDLATIRTLEATVATLPCRTIATDNSPYLTRWYVWPSGPRTVATEGSNLPFAVFLHKFHRGDNDKEQHNHPWDMSVSIILAGGYREERGSDVKIFTPGMVNTITKDDFHRVDLLNPTMGCWSLFIAGRNVGGWGFKDPVTGVFIPHQDFV